MEPEAREYKTAKLDTAVRYVGIVVALVYVGLGILILSRSSEFFPTLPKKYVLPAGIVFIAYGLFRAYRMYKRIFNTDRD